MQVIALQGHHDCGCTAINILFEVFLFETMWVALASLKPRYSQDFYSYLLYYIMGVHC